VIAELLVLGAAFFVVWYFGCDRLLRRRLASEGITAIGDVRSGKVRVTGRAYAAGETLIAPGSGIRCLAYSVLVSEFEGGDTRDPLLQLHRSVPFWI
jgi:hypothetical protein